jgi:hypothetical protein
MFPKPLLERTIRGSSSRTGLTTAPSPRQKVQSFPGYTDHQHRASIILDANILLIGPTVHTRTSWILSLIDSGRRTGLSHDRWPRSRRSPGAGALQTKPIIDYLEGSDAYCRTLRGLGKSTSPSLGYSIPRLLLACHPPSQLAPSCPPPELTEDTARHDQAQIPRTYPAGPHTWTCLSARPADWVADTLQNFPRLGMRQGLFAYLLLYYYWMTGISVDASSPRIHLYVHAVLRSSIKPSSVHDRVRYY